MNKVYAPFTSEQVESINFYQHEGRFHPFTCGSGSRTDESHLDSEGLLIAKKEGMECPYCNYKQDWVHEFMADIPVPEFQYSESFISRIKEAYPLSIESNRRIHELVDNNEYMLGTYIDDPYDQTFHYHSILEANSLEELKAIAFEKKRRNELRNEWRIQVNHWSLKH